MGQTVVKHDVREQWFKNAKNPTIPTNQVT